MTRTIAFTVPGTPSGKGSMRPFNDARTGKAMMQPDNRERLKDWTADIKLFASQKWGGRAPTEEAVSVEVHFFFLRPKSHFGAGKNVGMLKKTAPFHVKAKKNDIDKLARALLDALTGMVFVDDGQVVILNATKRYDGVPRMEVIVKTDAN